MKVLYGVSYTYTHTHFISPSFWAWVMPLPFSPLMQFSFFHVKVFTRFSSRPSSWEVRYQTYFPFIRGAGQCPRESFFRSSTEYGSYRYVWVESHPRSYICRKNRRAYSETQIHNSSELFRLDRSRFQYQSFHISPYQKFKIRCKLHDIFTYVSIEIWLQNWQSFFLVSFQREIVTFFFLL